MPSINLLRFHEAETAMLFCATRDNVRHLHASLVERGFAAVALSGEHSQSERNHALQALRDRRARVCVATDVAARGIDLPTLSLVVHVELPRDAETLQHRSGRTGRAGKKGIAVLIVPYPRRRRVEMMLRGARIEAEWIGPPDRRRDPRAATASAWSTTLLEPVEIDEEDRELGRAPARRAQRPRTSPPRSSARTARACPRPRNCSSGSAGSAPARRRRAAPRPASRTRSGSASMSAGATMRTRAGSCPCCAGAATSPRTRSARSASPPNETLFEIPRAVAGRFIDAVARTAGQGRR